MDKEQYSPKTDSTSQIAAREQRVAEARKFNLLSNVFMSVALNDKPACQYVLRILTGISDLIVKEIRSQYRISKIQSHDAILDVLAEDGAKRLYNLEIQRAETIDHARRTRFYGAMIDSEYLEKGISYAAMPDVYIIYISETDLWKAGCTAYPVEKYFKNTNIAYEDGQHILYVNAAVNDGTETAMLMQYFKTADPNDLNHGALSKRVHYLKCEEGGYLEMCEISEKIYEEGKKEGREEGREEGKLENQRENVLRMHRKGYPDSTIAELLDVNIKRVQEWISANLSVAR